LLNLIGGLDVATSGELTVLGQRLDHLTEARLTEYRRGTVGYVFQLFNLVPTLTALENVTLVGDLVGTGHRALDLLKSVGLGDRANQFPSQLSGGEQQRVGIARALVKEPRLLLADEPTGSLDSETGRHVLQLLWSQTRRRAVTVLIVTHNEEYAACGDLIIRLQSGRVVQVQEQSSPRQPSELNI
jgi:putative ABC transport system ATP-binding protein